MVRDDRNTILQGWLDRLREGDDAAREPLLVAASERLARLARKMLRRYPGVRRWELTDDVLQNALIRLDRALRSVAPPTASDFFRLAAAQIRRELIDLSRHYFGPAGLGANHGTLGEVEGEVPLESLEESTFEPRRLAAWTEFHERVEGLAEEDRQLFDLLWYQGLTQAAAAAVLGVTERTVNAKWVKARLRLHRALGGQLPD